MSQPLHVLSADIGGTHARFLVARVRGDALEPVIEATLAVADHPDVEDAARAFLARAPGIAVERACLAVAGPVEGRCAQLTNAAWRIDADRVATALAIPSVRLCNDFEAAAAGVGDVAPGGLVPLQVAPARDDGMRVVIGAGTGLGVAYVAPGAPPRVIAGEGGHAGFAPVDDEQAALWRFLASALGRVTNEHVLSGAGIVRLYAFKTGGVALPQDVAREGAAAVVRRAEAGDAAADAALRLFVSVYGAVAGDHALAVLATGGVYLAGGIAPRLVGRFQGGAFRDAFCNKGGHATLMRRMPVTLIRDGRLGLVGAARQALA